MDGRGKSTQQAMLVATKDAVSSAASIEPSNPLVESESTEEDDGWVIVKKRKITILIPPSPPLHPQPRSPEMNCIPANSKRRVESISLALKRRRRKHSKAEHGKPAATPSAKGSTQIAQEFDALLGNAAHIDGPNHFSGKLVLQQASPVHVDAPVGSKRTFGSSETIRGAPTPPIGALSIVNRRLRAFNLERKLQGLGGLRSWLLSQGLGRFARIFEREKLSRYQLANLTMSKLKDLGADAVGPRRKLIHAIHRLCQPYYFDALQSDACWATLD